jgi:hypothetical protein
MRLSSIECEDAAIVAERLPHQVRREIFFRAGARPAFLLRHRHETRKTDWILRRSVATVGFMKNAG